MWRWTGGRHPEVSVRMTHFFTTYSSCSSRPSSSLTISWLESTGFSTPVTQDQSVFGSLFSLFSGPVLLFPQVGSRRVLCRESSDLPQVLHRHRRLNRPLKVYTTGTWKGEIEVGLPWWSTRDVWPDVFPFPSPLISKPLLKIFPPGLFLLSSLLPR